MKFLQHNVWAVVSISVVFSFLFPALGTLVAPFLSMLFMILTFFSTINIRIPEVIKDIHHPKKTFVILAIIHLLSPLFVLMMKPYLDPLIFLGLIIAGVVPSGIAVIFLTRLFGGDTSRSLVITTLSNLLSPITVPLLVFLLAGKSVDVDPYQMSWKIFTLIVIPFIAAQYVAHTHWEKRLEKHSLNVLIISLLLITIGIISPLRNYIMSNILLSLMLGGIVTILTAINFFVGYSLAHDLETKISYAVSSTNKNYVLSTILATSLFGSVVALPAIMYAIVNSFMLIPMQWFIEGRQRR